MSTLQPLPLTDGAFLIDNSGLERLRCPRCFQHSEIDLRVPVAERAGANFGSTMHRGWECRYKQCGTSAVQQSDWPFIETGIRDWLAENPQPEGDFRNLDHACKMMKVYNDIYRNEEFKILSAPKTSKPIIEASFALPFGSVQNIPIIYCGKIDLGIEDSNGIWSFDHKTAFQFGDTFDKQMSMDGGQLGYCWALGETLGRPANGYIIDACRVRRPKAGRGDEFGGGVAQIDGSDFKRTPYWVSKPMIDEWKQDVLTLIDNIFNYHASGHFPRHRWNCTNKFGLCDYFDVCSTPIEQREQVLASGLFEDNKWTPLKPISP